MNYRDDDSTNQQHPADIQSEITDPTEAEGHSDEPEDEDSDSQTDHKNWGMLLAESKFLRPPSQHPCHLPTLYYN